MLEQLCKSILEQDHAPIVVCDMQSTVVYMNPAGNAAALTVTPLAGGTRPVSAPLVITQIA